MTSPQPLDTPIHRVLAKVKHKAAGQGKWMAVCPAHDDRQASLSIKVGQDGRVLLNCHANCRAEDVVGAIGLTMGDLFTPDTKWKPETNTADPRNRPRLVKTYDYTDANGDLVFQTCRFEPKTFRQRRPDGQGNWLYNLDGVEPVLYNLPAVIEAVALGKLIHLVEGEKDADALTEAGYVATTAPMGAGKWKDAFSKILTNAAVVIFPDNDEPGQKHAEHVAAELTKRGSTVRIVKLPGLPAKGDVSDWFDLGGDEADLPDLIAKAQPWGPRRVKWKLSELWNNEIIMRPPPAVVPRIAWVGRSTLLAAREKSGKSTLTGYITARVSKGEQFLDEYCVRGDVLVVGLEEYLGDVARRLKHFGADGNRVTLVDGFLGDGKSRMEEITQHVEDITPALVIVDSLVAFGNDRGIDENDAAMATIVQPLTDLAHTSGTAMVIVHHANKAAGKARGSTAITGGTDVVCEFSAPEEDTDPTMRRMRSVGRVPLVRSYDLRFDGDTYSLNGGDQAPLDSRIVNTIRERPGISTNDLAATVGGRRETVIATLNRMQAERVVENTSHTFARAKWIVPGNKLI